MKISDQLVEEVAGRLSGLMTPEMARALLALDVTTPSVDQRERWAAQANEGTLSAEEREEYLAYLQVRMLISLLQSHARLRLAEA